jgi:hypothetical protein
MQHFNGTISQAEQLTVGGFMNGKLGLSVRAVYNRGSRNFGKIQVPRHKVRMEMGLEYEFYRGLPLFCQLKISIDIPQGVNNSSFTGAFNIIGCFTQAPGIQLLDEHTLHFYAKLAIIIDPGETPAGRLIDG